MVKEWNLQLAKASWCQRERWRHLPYVTYIAILCRSGIVLTGALKMTDMKMTDQIAGHEDARNENAGHEIARHDKNW